MKSRWLRRSVQRFRKKMRILKNPLSVKENLRRILIERRFSCLITEGKLNKRLHIYSTDLLEIIKSITNLEERKINSKIQIWLELIKI